MKKIIAMVLCLTIILSFSGCRKTESIDDKPNIKAEVIDYWGTSFTVECVESSLEAIKEGTRIFIEKSAMNNEKDWIKVDIGDQVQIVYDAEHIKDDVNPMVFEVVYAIYLLDENGNVISE